MTYADNVSTLPAMTAGGGSGVGRLQKAAIQPGDDVSGHLTKSQIAEIGMDVVADWDRDREGNKEWRDKVEEALKSAAQEDPDKKTYPWPGASNVQYPLLTISGVQFNARAYPAIVKGEEAIKIKTFGKDADGKKAKRAKRMAEYLNWKLFYGVEGWEEDTDGMLLKLPIVGHHFRKVWWDPIEGKPCIESVSALRLTIPSDARTLKSSPRITHDFDRYPYELQRLMKRGHYRQVELVLEKDDDDQASRLILEQHRMMDLDEDGLDEPYIVTVDHATTEVLRIEEAFGENDVKSSQDGSILSIDRWCPFVGYPFIPDPKGRAYAIGFGHLLKQIMAVINTTINMQIDAGHAQVAGGGFISAEIRLQGAGRNPGAFYFEPGKYATVNASAADLRNGIYERTFPEPSAVLFQLLGMLMEAARDIASVNDAITGDAARTAPVGTTLALIEQGQQVFNAIYKRVYRSLREEFRLFVDLVRKYGDPAEYARFLDEDDAPDPMMGHNGGPTLDPAQSEGQPQGMVQGAQPPQPGMMGQPPAQQPQQPVPVDPEAMFRADFASDDLDVRPVSDPSAVTKMQQLAKDQFALSFLGKSIYSDDRAVVRTALTDAGIEQAEEWIPEQAPPPNPLQMQVMALKAELEAAKAKQATSVAVLNTAKAAEIAHNNTGDQSDAALAEQHAKSQQALASAASTAAGLIPGLAEGDGPAPTAQPAPPEYA